jgi:hypothetical protein
MYLVNRSFLEWLTVGNRLFWLGIFLPLAVFAAAIRIGWGSDTAIRSAGYVLSLAGAWAVLRGLLKAQRVFNPKPMKQRFREHLITGGRAARGSQSAIVTASGFGVVPMLGQLSLKKISGRRNIDARVAELEDRVAALGDSVAQETGARISADQEIRTQLQLDRDRKAAALAEVQRQLADVATGDWMTQMSGVSWLIIGQACTTFSVEIAHYLPLGVLTWLR